MRKVCKKQKLSQMDPHIATGLDRTFISDLESGIQGPSLHLVFRGGKRVGNPCGGTCREHREITSICLPCGWQVTSYRQSMAISQYLQ
jgi:hypothetical protein